MNRVEDVGSGGALLVESAPRDGVLRVYGDDGVLLYPHLLVLVVLAPQEPHGRGVLLGVRVQKLRLAAYHHESEQSPVLGVSVGDQGYMGVLEDVSDALDRRLRQGVANGHGVRLPRPVGGREAGHPLAHEKGSLLLT